MVPAVLLSLLTSGDFLSFPRELGQKIVLLTPDKAIFLVLFCLSTGGEDF